MNKKISRKEAIQKAGVTALAASSLLLLKTNSASAASTAVGNPGNDKPVGKATETPNDGVDWGDGSDGVSG